MAECSECGKETMSFTCRYCDQKFCSEHRLPENHDCPNLEDEVEKEREETGKWFKEKKVRNEIGTSPPTRTEPSLLKDSLRTLKSNYTLAIILFTTFIYLLQPVLPGVTPPITTQQQVDLIMQNPMNLNPMVLWPTLEYLVQRPWSLLTLMFLHAGAFHLFANMVTFYFFGSPVERLMSGRDYLKFYFGTGIAASIGFVAFQNFLVYGLGHSASSAFGPAVGASGAVVAMFSAVAMLYPDAEVLLYFFIPMKIGTALRLFAGIETVGLVSKVAGFTLPIIGNFAFSAHLTGLAIGIWYGKKLREKHSQQVGVLDLLGH